MVLHRLGAAGEDDPEHPLANEERREDRGAPGVALLGSTARPRGEAPLHVLHPVHRPHDLYFGVWTLDFGLAMRYASMNGVREPFRTASVLPVSYPVRWSLTMRYG